jgi:GntR family transcriptional regulator, transcriptional repressor for pyruvate dehydrogenase complex
MTKNPSTKTSTAKRNVATPAAKTTQGSAAATKLRSALSTPGSQPSKVAAKGAPKVAARTAAQKPVAGKKLTSRAMEKLEPKNGTKNTPNGDAKNKLETSIKNKTVAKKQSPAKRVGMQESIGMVASWPGATNQDNTIRVRKAGEVVAERFRHQIANGTLAIGHQLPSEEELTTMFGIARTTLREALRVLESQGLLEIKRGRGGGGIITMPRLENLSQSLALVLQLQHTTLGDLDDARMMIEPPLAGRLASQHTDEDLEILTAIVDRANDCAEADDKHGFGTAAAMLHEAIIERGGNNTMAVIGALLHDLMDRHFHSAAEISDHEQMSRAVRSYRKLIQLIESGDSAAATAHWHRQLVFLQQRRASIQLLDIFND